MTRYALLHKNDIVAIFYDLVVGGTMMLLYAKQFDIPKEDVRVVPYEDDFSIN